MIYVDASVALAYLLVETRRPDRTIWDNQLVSSRLLEYEVWNRLHVHKTRVDQYAKEVARTLLRRVDMLDMNKDVLSRALLPFPVSVRTLDGLHIATIEFLRARHQSVALASYDVGLIACATALGIRILDF